MLKPWDNTFIFILAHSSREEAKKNWNAFRNDPAFQEVVQSASSSCCRQSSTYPNGSNGATEPDFLYLTKSTTKRKSM
jgi:hypothetical protein